MQDVYEALQRARSSILSNTFDWRNWETCSCGHIYASANNRSLMSTRRQAGNSVITDPEEGSLYHRTLEIVVNANKWASRPYGLVQTVSIATKPVELLKDPELTDPRAEDPTKAIIAIDTAIAYIEEQFEQDRLAVLSQTKEVVDNADVREPALV